LLDFLQKLLPDVLRPKRGIHFWEIHEHVTINPLGIVADISCPKVPRLVFEGMVIWALEGYVQRARESGFNPVPKEVIC